MKQTKVKVITLRQLPSRLPIQTSVVTWLAVDRWQPPGWVVGMLVMLLGLLWLGAICLVMDEEHVEVKDLQ